MTSIESILKKKGPLLSGELAKIIGDTTGASNEAIRKRLSRAAKPIYRIKGFFADNQVFFYLEEHYTQEIFFEKLRQAFKSAAKRMYVVIKAIEFHQGYLKIGHLPAYTFSPIEKLVGHKLVYTLIEELKNLRVIQSDGEAYILNLHITSIRPSSNKEYKAIETAKNFVLTQFLSWARSIGITSYNTGAFYSEFAKFRWGFTSPSYISSLTRQAGDRIVPAFILADVLIGKESTEDDVLFFVEKVKILRAQKNPSRHIPVLIVDSVTPEALQLLKKNGVVVGFVNKLFGYEYSDLLKALINTITNAGAILKRNPEQYLDLISKLNKLVDGKTNNLRGDLFELAVGFYHSRLCRSLDIGKQINHDGYTREIDVFAVYANEVKVAECKGYKTKITLSQIDDWLKTISIIRNWMLDQNPYRDKDLVFEFWSTGGFKSDALKKLKEVSRTVKKYQILYYGPKEIMQKGKEVKSPKFNDILRQYYFGEDL